MSNKIYGKKHRLVVECCFNHDMVKLKTLLNSPDEDIKQIYWEKIFVDMASTGNLKIVEFLLENKKVKEDCCRNEAIVKACKNGKLNVVEYLIQFEDVINKKIMNDDGIDGFSMACELGHLEIVKFLFYNEKTKNVIDLHNRRDSAFKNAARNNHINVIEFLIFEANIEKTKSLEYFIEPGILEENTSNEIKKMFEKREFEKNLREKMNNPINNIKNKSNKV